MTDQPRKRILIDPPSEMVILAARHLDATEGPVQVGSVVDTATRSAITTVLRYVAKAHNAPPEAGERDAPRRPCRYCPDPLCPEDCPECGSPIHDLNTPKEQPAPDTGHGICTATIDDNIQRRIFHCAQKAGHYDEDKMPEPTDGGDPGGWHQSAPDPELGPLRWSDRADGATPHRPEPVDATPDTADQPPAHGCTIDGQPAMPILMSEHTELVARAALMDLRVKQAAELRVRLADAEEGITAAIRQRNEAEARAQRAEAELRRYTEADSADAAAGSYAGRAEQAEQRLRLAHQARRAKEHQLDGIRRALCDIGAMQDDDPYSHADLEDVIRQTFPKGDSKDAAPTTPDLLAETAAMLQEVAPAAPDAEPNSPFPAEAATCGHCNHPADWHDRYEGCVGPNGIGGLGSGDCPCTRGNPFDFSDTEPVPEEPPKPTTPADEQYRFATTWSEYNAGRKAAADRKAATPAAAEVRDCLFGRSGGRPCTPSESCATCTTPAAVEHPDAQAAGEPGRRRDDDLRALHAAVSRIRNIDRVPPHVDPDSTPGRFYINGWEAALDRVRTELVDLPGGAGCSPGVPETEPDNPAAPDAEPDTVTDPAWLHQQYAKAIAADDGHPWDTLSADRQESYLDNADAVMRVRDRHLDQLRQRLTLADQVHRDDLAETERLRARLGKALACVKLLKIYANQIDHGRQVGGSDVASRIRHILTGLDERPVTEPRPA